MQRHRLGKTDLTVTPAPFGAMYLGTKQDRDTSFELLDRYVELGGDFIDTANIYAHWVAPQWRGGESEEVLGAWMRARGNRDGLTITSKVGIAYGDVPMSLSPEIIAEQCDISLKRLGVEQIDLYFAHKDDPSVPQEAVLEAFARLIESGKVRAIGASNFSTDRLASANALAERSGLPRYEVLQQRYTYLPVRRGADTGRQVILTEDMRSYCARESISIMAYSVGIQGAYDRDPGGALPEGFRTAGNETRIEVLRSLAREVGCTPGQCVLAWVWSHPGTMPLIACSRLAQLEENMAAMKIRLSADQIDRLDRAAE